MIVIIDYHMGNLRSVFKAFRRLNIDVIISSDKEEIYKADKIILPGVGHFKNGMIKLNELGLIDILNEKVINDKTPILGICLGMQLFTNSSEEGNVNGLGWIDAETIKFNFIDKKLKIPHMGWNNIEIINKSNLFINVEIDDLFYFVHSYYVKCNDENDILTFTNYGGKFVSSFKKENIYGTQFHPEKSHSYGLKIIENFIKI